MKQRSIVSLVSALVAGALVLAPAAQAAPKPKPSPNANPKAVQLTSEQLTAVGFPTTPNIVAWGQPVTISRTTAPVWGDIVIAGKAPDDVAIGQVLTMERFYPSDVQGTGIFKALNITATVAADRTFAMRFQLGYPGTWGYRVGFTTSGPSPEVRAFQFQITTTGSAKPAPKPDATAVDMSSKALADAGFTKTPNVAGWGGTASISTEKAKAGTPITLVGKAPSALKPGTILQLSRFVATDRQGSGHLVPLPGVITAVQADQSYSLTFELYEKGVYGLSFGAPVGTEVASVEFQVKTT